jgi:6-phosphogluconolactonase (cycloisomerase 2 family)
MARIVRHHHHIVRAAAVALAAGLALHGAARGAQAQVPTRLAYSANADGSVGIFSVSPATGALAALGSVQPPGDPTAIAVDPSGRFVFVAQRNENLVSAYGIDSAAGLSLVGSVMANNPAALGLEPSGRFLYVADAVLGEISTFRIRSNGEIRFAARTDAGSRAVALAVHPSGRFLYGLDADTARVLAYRVDAGTGSLVAVGSPDTGVANPVALALEPRGRFLYVLHHLEHIVTVFRIDPGSGAATQIQTLGVKNPVAIAVEQTGRFLYIASPDNDALFAYRISQTDGRLTHVATELLAQPAPVSVTVDPTNRFVYAASVTASRVTRLTINPASGMLVEGPSLPVAGRPAAVAVAHPAERFVYAPGSPLDGNDVLQAFRIDAGTGALALIDDLVLNDSLTELTLEPTGRFVYVLGRNSDAIETFRIDLSSGQLTSIQTLVVPELGGLASALTAEPTGRFLYVTCACNATNSRIRAFRINAGSGLLTDLGATGGEGTFTATASTTDLTGRFLYMARVNGGGIEAFAINQTTGLLTGLGATPYNSAAGELVMDPLGRFLFVANQTGFVEAFRVSAATGTLTSSGTPILMESGMRGASIDRTGRFFYPVTRGTGGRVHVFAIDPVNGDLEVSGVPAVYLGDSDVGESAAVDTTGRFLHVGHRKAGLSGIRTFAINPSTGAVTATSDVTMPFAPFSLGTSGRIR